MQFLSRIYVFSSVKFPETSNCGCVKKTTNMSYDNDIFVKANLFRCAKTTLNTFDPADISATNKLDDANSNS